MKEEIFAIPLWDAFREDKECPLCVIEMDIEKKYIDRLLDGSTVMDVEFNRKLKDYIFCENHFRKLFEYPDKLGLALIVARLFSYEIKDMEKEKNRAKPDHSLVNIFSRKNSNEKSSNKDKECYLCKHIDKTMSEYIETLVKLWEKNKEFRALYESSKGYCLGHFHRVIKQANRLYDKRVKEEFLNLNYKIQLENMERLNDELNWFIKKFDYRFVDEPWKNSRDSLFRSIIKLTGYFIDDIK
ncbi:MAG: DUF6062 family protein [Halanaerobiales bacterium]